jgi:hypothetical protein
MNFENPDSKDFVKMLGRIAHLHIMHKTCAKLLLYQIKIDVAGSIVYTDEVRQTLIDQLNEIGKKNGVKFGYGKRVVTLQQDNLPDKQNIQPTWKISLSDNTLSTVR